MDEGEREPKISLVEFLFVGAAIFVLEFVSEIPLLGPLFNFAVTQGYLAMKGMSGTYQLVMLGGNLITEILSSFGLGIIPVDFVVFSGIAAVDHFAPSSVAEGLEKAGAVVGAIEGKVAGGAAAGTAAGEEAAAAGKAAAGTARAAAGEVGTVATTEASAAGEAAGGTGGRAAAGETSAGEAGGGPEGGSAEKKIEPEALGEERELLGGEGKLQKEFFEETPTGSGPETAEPEAESRSRLRKSFEKAQEVKRKVEDISQHMPRREEGDAEEDEGEGGEEYRKAA